MTEEEDIRQEIEHLEEFIRLMKRVKKLCIESGNMMGLGQAEDDIRMCKHALKKWQRKWDNLPKQ